MKHHKNKKQDGKSLGNSGSCICDNCGQEIPHQRGIKCMDLKCSSCGSTLNRKESTTRVTQQTFRSIIAKASILRDLCVGCYLCIESCPFGAITIENMKALIDEDKCRGCMKCEPACPQDAIIRS